MVPVDSGAFFQTIAHHNIMQNYVRIYGKVYLADGVFLDIVRVRDINMKMLTKRVWKITKVRHVPTLVLEPRE